MFNKTKYIHIDLFENFSGIVPRYAIIWNILCHNSIYSNNSFIFNYLPQQKVILSPIYILLPIQSTFYEKMTSLGIFMQNGFPCCIMRIIWNHNLFFSKNVTSKKIIDKYYTISIFPSYYCFPLQDRERIMEDGKQKLLHVLYLTCPFFTTFSL